MNKPRHTPGPWTAEDEVVTLSDGKKVYARAANARLIAAAPELLEALEFTIAQLKMSPKYSKDQDLVEIAIKADGAITKARGDA